MSENLIRHRRRITGFLLPVLLCLSLGAWAAVGARNTAPPPKFRWAASRYPTVTAAAPRPLPGSSNGPVSAAGTIAAAQQAVSLPVSSQGLVACQITGTWVATLVFEGTVDNVNWVTLRASAIATDTLVTSTTGNGLFILGPGLTAIRVRASAYTSGTATVTLLGSPGAGVNYPLSAVGAGGGGGGGAVTIADAADVALGATADAAVQGDVAGTVSAKLRGLNKSIAAGIPVTQSTSPWVVAGGVAPGAAVSQNPVLIAGQFGGNIKMFGLTTAGELLVSATTPLIVNASGNAANGAALVGNPVLTAGSDGTNARTFSTDSGGRQWVRPSDSTGAALFPDGVAMADAVTNPTLTRAAIFPNIFNGTTWDRQRSASSATGTTGTGLQAHAPLLWDLVGTTNFVKQGGDGSGRAMVVGAAAAGAAVAGNPLLMGISDGTNAQTLRQSPATLASQTTVGVPLMQMALYGSGANQANPWGAANGQGDTNSASALSASGSYVYNGTNWDRTRGTAAGGTWVQGPAASGAALAGNPVLIGASTGSGILNLRINSGPGDGAANGSEQLITQASGYDYNGSTWDRHRNNVDVTLLASAARTTLQNSANILTYNAHSIIVTLDLTASGGAISLTPSINYIDPASGKTIPLLTATTIAATGTFTYAVNPNFSSATGATYPYTKVAQADLGRVITINIAVGNANSQTYSVGYTLVN